MRGCISGAPVNPVRRGENPYPGLRYAWSVVGILLLLAVLSYTDRYVLTLLVNPIRRELEISDVQISFLLGTSFAIVYGFFGIIAGMFADRSDRRNLIMVGVVVWSVGTIGCGLSPTFNGIFTARMVVGLGEAILTPAAISLIGDYFEPSRRGAAVGVYMMGVPLGSGIAAIVGSVVLKLVEQGMLDPVVAFTGSAWRTVLVVLGAPGLLLVWLMLLVKEPTRRDIGAAPASTPAAYSSGRENSFSIWFRVMPVFIGSAGMALAVACLIAWGPSVLIREFSMEPSNVGFAVGLSFAVGGSGGVLLGGILSDRARARFGPRARSWMCLAGTALALPCAMFGMSQILLLALLGMALFIMFADWTISGAIATVLDEVPNRSRGLATSLAFFLNVVVGAGLGPTLVALADGELGLGGQNLGFSIFVVATPVLLVALFAFGFAARLSASTTGRGCSV